MCVTMIFSHVFPLDSLVINHLQADLISIKLTPTSGHLILIKSTCKRLITSESGGFPLKFSVGDWDRPKLIFVRNRYNYRTHD